MKTRFKESFLKDLKKIKDKALKKAIYNVILQVELANQPTEISHLKKMKGTTTFYRIRVKTYRIGVEILDNEAVFLVFDHRKSIYRKFP